MDVIQFLKQSPLFSTLSKNAIWRLSDLAQLKDFKQGEIILQEGAMAKGCYIIVSGNVEVIKALGTPQEKSIAQLDRGEIIGEMAVIDDSPHSATVRTLEDTQCIMISQWDFKAQMQAYPEIALQLLPIIVQRLRRFEEQKFMEEFK